MSAGTHTFALEALLDRAAITSVLHDYCRLLDDRRLDEMVDAVWAPQGTDQRRADVVTVGRADIAAMLGRSLGPIEATVHQLSNIQVSVEGDTATAFSYVQACHWMAATRAAGPARPTDFVVAGTYTDRFVRLPEGWRIASRVVGFRGPAGLLFGQLPATSTGFAGGPTSYDD